ncbi:hypothetical protein BGV52_16710 [Burkholderia ubonensis]|nr:hypothetical protein BGV52_16710 [Burkholderia ubonensis]
MTADSARRKTMDVGNFRIAATATEMPCNKAGCERAANVTRESRRQDESGEDLDGTGASTARVAGGDCSGTDDGQVKARKITQRLEHRAASSIDIGVEEG